jgi:ribosome modulation factor
MKRQKRDQTERAFTKGYQAGIDGRSRSLCPHDSGTARQQWLNGWRESRVDQWDGLNRMAQVQKLSNIQQTSAIH